MSQARPRERQCPEPSTGVGLSLPARSQVSGCGRHPWTSQDAWSWLCLRGGCSDRARPVPRTVATRCSQDPTLAGTRACSVSPCAVARRSRALPGAAARRGIRCDPRMPWAQGRGIRSAGSAAKDHEKLPGLSAYGLSDPLAPEVRTPRALGLLRVSTHQVAFRGSCAIPASFFIEIPPSREVDSVLATNGFLIVAGPATNFGWCS